MFFCWVALTSCMRASSKRQPEARAARGRLVFIRATFGEGRWFGWRPSSSSNFSIRAFALILFVKLDKQFSIERFEPTVSQSTVPSPLSNMLCPVCILKFIKVWVSQGQLLAVSSEFGQDYFWWHYFCCCYCCGCCTNTTPHHYDIITTTSTATPTVTTTATNIATAPATAAAKSYHYRYRYCEETDCAWCWRCRAERALRIRVATRSLLLAPSGLLAGLLAGPAS